MNITTLLILALATWRLASLFANEMGPWDMFEKIRKRLGVRYQYSVEGPDVRYGQNVIAKGLMCTWCNSIWFGAAIVGLYVLYHPIVFVLLPLSLSAGVIVLDKVLNGTS